MLYMFEDDVASFFTGYEVSSDEDDVADQPITTNQVVTESQSFTLTNTRSPADNLLQSLSKTSCQIDSNVASTSSTDVTPSASSTPSTSTSDVPAAPVVGSATGTGSGTGSGSAEGAVAARDRTPVVVPDIIVFCSCQSQCYRNFEQQDLTMNILNCAELSISQLDFALIAKLQAFTNAAPQTSRRGHAPRERKQVHAQYLHQGIQICRDLFLKIHGIGKDRLTNLKAHAVSHGLTPRQKKSGGRNSMAMSYEQHVALHSFLTNYAEEQGVKLPGRVPGS